MTANRRRPGVTLIEVLMATGILAIGLLSILALFPIGAVNMARAITQSRSSDHGANSDATFRVYWKQAWVDSVGGGVRASNEDAYQYSQEPVLLLLDAHPTYGAISRQPTAQNVTTQPGFPVLIDPIGWQTNLTDPVAQRFVAGNQNLPSRTTLRRCFTPQPWTPYDPAFGPGGPARAVPAAITLPAAPYFVQPAYTPIISPSIRLTTLLDDLTFDKAGEPDARTGQIERAGRYSAAWLVQRPNTSVPTELHITVLVYAGRPPTDTASAETQFTARIPSYTDAANPPQTILVDYGVNQPKPGFRKGGFVAFSTMINPAGSPNTPSVAYPTLDFYRIGGMQDDEASGVLLLDLERPVKGYGLTTTNAAANGGVLTGIAIHFDTLVEVFDRGTVSATGVSGR